MNGSSVLGLLGAMAVTCGLLMLAIWVLRRVQRGGATARGIPLGVIQRISTGPKQGMALVRCGERVLLMSCTEAGMTLVTELTGTDRERLVAEAQAAAMPVITPEPAFAAVARRHGFHAGRAATLGLLLVLGTAGAARAQSPAPAPAPGATPAVTPVPNALDASQLPVMPAIPLPKAGPVISNIVTAPKPEAQRPAAPAGPQMPMPRVDGPGVPQINFTVGEGANGLKLSGTVGIVVFMGALTLLPAMFLLMTSFTRILIVLHFLRTALGTQSTPPGQLLVAIAVMLTGVVMTPVLERANRDAIQPYLDGKVTQVQAYQAGIIPFREFMLANMREPDLAAFVEMTGREEPKSIEEIPTLTVVSAFIVGELRTAFQMGFVIFLPFVVIDLIVASVLMSMGMFMLPPLMISLPFKLLLFVLADGWTLVVRNLVVSFKAA